MSQSYPRVSTATKAIFIVADNLLLPTSSLPIISLLYRFEMTTNAGGRLRSSKQLLREAKVLESLEMETRERNMKKMNRESRLQNRRRSERDGKTLPLQK